MIVYKINSSLLKRVFLSCGYESPSGEVHTFNLIFGFLHPGIAALILGEHPQKLLNRDEPPLCGKNLQL